MNYFYNHSDRPSTEWTEEQRSSALTLGRVEEIIDIPLPVLDPEKENVYYEAFNAASQILPYINDASDDDLAKYDAMYAGVCEIIIHLCGPLDYCVWFRDIIVGRAEEWEIEVRFVTATTKHETFDFARFRFY